MVSEFTFSPILFSNSDVNFTILMNEFCRTCILLLIDLSMVVRKFPTFFQFLVMIHLSCNFIIICLSSKVSSLFFGTIIICS